MDQRTEAQSGLRAFRCIRCTHLSLPACPVCPECLGSNFEPVELPAAGVLYTFTFQHVGLPEGQSPLGLGYVDLASKLRALVQLTPPFDQFAVNQTVDLRETSDGLVASPSAR